LFKTPVGNIKCISMKLYIAATLLLLTCLACKKASFDVPDAGQYTRLYMPQAQNTPNIQTLFIRDTAQTIFFNAYCGGPYGVPGNIKVDFEAAPDLVDSFNTANETNYLPMPDGSYTIETEGTIDPSTKSTGSLQLKINTKGVIDVFKPYLLPVRIKDNTGGVHVNNELRTSFFLITASYAPGQVPREHLLKIESDTLPVFQWGTGSTTALVVRHTDNNLYRYPYNPADGTFAASQLIGVGWGNVDIFMPFVNPPNNDRWICRNKKDAGIYHYLVTPTGGFTGQAQTGWGWNGFDILVGYRGSVYSRDRASGIMTRWPYAIDFSAGVKSMEGNWAAYTQIVPFKNSLLGTHPNGDLYEHQVSADGKLGSVRRVGTGWDMYKKIFQFENDLCGVDANGDIWRYKFDPLGFWALKE
jgi:hypothetical protein